tara:strand:+ start:5815 stop:6672 length:858 start_codon:yes stop_codon:yes gene_type:complete
MDNKIKSKGYLYLRNIINKEKIRKIQKYIHNTDFNRSIKFNVVDIIKKTFVDEHDIFLGSFIDGHNNFVTGNVEKDRQVFQLWQLVKDDRLGERNIKLSENNSNIGYNVKKESIEFVKDFYKNNKTFFDNTIINDLLNMDFLKNTYITSIKLFYNLPNCCEQEIHMDDVEDDITYLTIPLNFHEKCGNTVVYNNKYVNKYKKIISKNLLNFGYINTYNEDKKKDFLKAESIKILNVGDILVFGGHTFHKGGKNRSNYPRMFLHLRFKKKKKLSLNLNTINLLHNY